MPGFRGLMFIGDPHLESRVPGFRCDDYPQVALKKMAWCLKFARQENLQPVLLGDQVDKSLGQLSGTPIPIRLTGNLYEPDIKVDVVAALAGSQKELINQKANELVDQYLGGKDSADGDSEEDGTGQSNDQVKSLLGGLLGGKKKDKKKEDDGGGY